MDAVLIGLGGATGAVLRYVVGLLLRNRPFPWATLVVNALGSFVLGVIIFGVSNHDLILLVGVGFCGAFTTFSSFSFQTMLLWERDDHVRALVNAFGNLIVSLVFIRSAWLLMG